MSNEQASLEARIIYDERIGKDKQIRDMTIGAYIKEEEAGVTRLKEVGMIRFEIEKKPVLLERDTGTGEAYRVETEKACCVKDVSVDSEYENLGVKSVMLNEMEEVAKEEKCDSYQRKAGPYVRPFKTFPELIEDLNKPFRF
jgi:GNAT superfamily N-acetyltransferase